VAVEIREIIERADREAFFARLATDVVWIGVYPGQLCRNREQVVAMLERAVNAERVIRPQILAERNGMLVVDPHADPQPEWVSELHQVIVVGEDDNVVEIRDYPNRDSALAALEVPW
jgi:hypothetical protein